jgi:hypothetical protein
MSKLIISIADGEVTNVSTEGFDLPPDTVIVVRDFDRGNVPDENGDLYVDEVLA